MKPILITMVAMPQRGILLRCKSDLEREISDSTCGAKHLTLLRTDGSDSDRDCTLACETQGATFACVSLF